MSLQSVANFGTNSGIWIIDMWDRLPMFLMIKIYVMVITQWGHLVGPFKIFWFLEGTCYRA